MPEEILSAESPLFEGRSEHEIAHIHAAIASAVADHEVPPLHSIHFRLALASTTRQQHWEPETKEASLVVLSGVKGGAFGSATPYAEFKSTVVPIAAQEFFSKAKLGQEYDVVLFPRPSKTGK